MTQNSRRLAVSFALTTIAIYAVGVITLYLALEIILNRHLMVAATVALFVGAGVTGAQMYRIANSGEL